MCFSMRPGNPSGTAALLFGMRRIASCMKAGVIHLEIIGVEADGVRWTCPSHGKGAPGGSVGSGDMVIFSICVSLAITSSGAVMRRPVVSSRSTERSVGREGASSAPSDVRRMDLSATLGFFMNMRSRALPYRTR